MKNDTMNRDSLLEIYSVTISVADIEKMTNWYQKVLGFERCSDAPIDVFDTRIQFLKISDFRIELIACESIAAPDRKSPPRHTEIRGIANFGLRTNDLAERKKLLIERGVEIKWESQNKHLGVRMMLIEDPEGNLIQFLEPNK